MHAFRAAGVRLPATRLSWTTLTLATIALGVATAAEGDFVYVTLGNNTVVRYDVSLGSSAAVEASAFTFASTSLNDPNGLAFDSAGNLYVANNGSSLVSVFNSSGASVASLGAGNLERPNGVAFDAAGNLYVANADGEPGLSNTIKKFTTAGTLLATATNVINPNGLAFNSAGSLYAANTDPTANNVSIFNASGVFTGTLGSSPDLDAPSGLAFDRDGNLYVSNFLGNSIVKYDTGGIVVSSISDNLVSPRGLAFDSAGNLYATNQGNSTISKFDSSGQFQFSWNTASNPRFIAAVPEPGAVGLVAVARACGGCAVWRRASHRVGRG